MMNSQKLIILLLEQTLEIELKDYINVQAAFQQESAPCHVSKTMKNYLKGKRFYSLTGQGMKLDLSPIETFWTILKTRLRIMDCTKKEKLIEAVIQICF